MVEFFCRFIGCWSCARPSPRPKQQKVKQKHNLHYKMNAFCNVFMVEDVSGSRATTQEHLVPLYFIEKPSNIVNDILIDLPDLEEPEITKENVEYYLEILVDNDLSDEYWAKLGAAPRSGEVFYNEKKFEKTEPRLNPDNSIRELYTSNNSGPFGEEC